MPQKGHAANAENQDPKIEEIRTDRLNSLKKGFEKITKGECPQITELSYLDTEDVDLVSISQ